MESSPAANTIMRSGMLTEDDSQMVDGQLIFPTSDKISPSSPIPSETAAPKISDADRMLVILKGMATGGLSLEEAASLATEEPAKPPRSATDLISPRPEVSLADSAVAGWDRGRAVNERGRLGARVLLDEGKMSVEQLDKLRDLETVIGKDLGYDSLLLEAVDSASEFVGQMSETVPEVAEQSMKAAMGGAIVGSAVPGVGSLAGWTTGLSIGAMWGVGSTTAMVEGGNHYLDLRLGNPEHGIEPLSHEDAKGFAVLVGAVNGALEAAGMKALGAAWKMAFKNLSGPALNKALKDPNILKEVLGVLKGYAIGTLGEAGTEMIQEVTTALSENIARDERLTELLDSKNPNNIYSRVFQVAKKTILGAGLLALPGAGVQAATTTNKVVRTRSAIANNTLKYIAELKKVEADIIGQFAEEMKAELEGQPAGKGKGQPATQLNIGVPPEGYKKISDRFKQVFDTWMKTGSTELSAEQEATLAKQEEKTKQEEGKEVTQPAEEAVVEGEAVPNFIAGIESQLAAEKGAPTPIVVPNGVSIDMIGTISDLDDTAITMEDRKKPFQVVWRFIDPASKEMTTNRAFVDNLAQAKSLVDRKLDPVLAEDFVGTEIYTRSGEDGAVLVASKKAERGAKVEKQVEVEKPKKSTEGKEELPGIPQVPDGYYNLPGKFGSGIVGVRDGSIVSVSGRLPSAILAKRKSKKDPLPKNAAVVFARAWAPAIMQAASQVNTSTTKGTQTSWAQSSWDVISSRGTYNVQELDDPVVDTNENDFIWDEDGRLTLAEAIGKTIERAQSGIHNYTDYEITTRWAKAQGELADTKIYQKEGVQITSSIPEESEMEGFLSDEEFAAVQKAESRSRNNKFIQAELNQLRKLYRQLRAAGKIEAAREVSQKAAEVSDAYLAPMLSRFRLGSNLERRVHTLESRIKYDGAYVKEPLSFRLAEEDVTGWIRTEGTFDPNVQEPTEAGEGIILSASPEFSKYVGKKWSAFRKDYPNTKFQAKKLKVREGDVEKTRVAKTGIVPSTMGEPPVIRIVTNGILNPKEGKAVVAALEPDFNVTVVKGTSEIVENDGKTYVKSYVPSHLIITSKTSGWTAKVEFKNIDEMAPGELETFMDRNFFNYLSEQNSKVVTFGDMTQLEDLANRASEVFSAPAELVVDLEDLNEIDEIPLNEAELAALDRARGSNKSKSLVDEFTNEYPSAEERREELGGSIEDFVVDPEAATDPDGGVLLGMGLGVFQNMLRKTMQSKISSGMSTPEYIAAAKFLEHQLDKRARYDRVHEGKLASARRGLGRAILDQHVTLKKVLDTLGTEGVEAVNAWVTQAGASAYSAFLNRKFRKDVVHPLRGDKTKLMLFNELVNARRMMALHALGGTFTNPITGKTVSLPPLATLEASNFITNFKTMAKDFRISGSGADTIMASVDKYFAWANRVLQDRYEGQTISMQTRDLLMNLPALDPQTIRYLIDPPIEGQASKRDMILTESGLNWPVGGMSSPTLNENAVELMTNFIFRSYSSIAKNSANHRLARAVKVAIDRGDQWAILPMKDPNTGKYIDSQGNELKRPEGWETVSYRVHGLKRSFWVDPRVYTAWTDREPGVSGDFSNVLPWITAAPLVKFLATGANIGFAITNIFNDASHQIMTSDVRRSSDGKFISTYSDVLPVAAGQFIRNAGSHLKDVIKDSPKLETMLELGVGMEFLSQMKQYTSDLYKTGTFVDGFLHVAGWLGSKSELLGRMALMEQAIRRISEIEGTGLSSEEIWSTWKTNAAARKVIRQAAFETRNYLDFTQGGTVVKGFDRFFPYFNAAVQVNRGIIRSANRNPKQFTLKFGQVLGAAMIYHVIARAFDPDDDLDKLSAKHRVLYWNFRLPDSVADPNERNIFSSVRIPMFTGPKDTIQRIAGGVADFLIDSAFKVSSWKACKGKGDCPAIRYDILAETGYQLFSVVPGIGGVPSMRALMAYIAGFDMNKLRSFVPEGTVYATSEREPDLGMGGTPKVFTDIGDLAAKSEYTRDMKLFSPARLHHFFKAIMPENNEWLITASAVYSAMRGDLEVPKDLRRYAVKITGGRWFRTFDPDERWTEKEGRLQGIEKNVNTKKFNLRLEAFNIFTRGYADPTPTNIARYEAEMDALQDKAAEMGPEYETSLLAFSASMEARVEETGTRHRTLVRAIGAMQTAEAKGRALAHVYTELRAQGYIMQAEEILDSMKAFGIDTDAVYNSFEEYEEELSKKMPVNSRKNLSLKDYMTDYMTRPSAGRGEFYDRVTAP